MKAIHTSQVEARTHSQHDAARPPEDRRPHASSLRPGLLSLACLLISLLTPVKLQAQATNTCVATPAGLVSWWRAETNGLDSVSSNHVILLNAADFAPGMSGWAFNFSGADQSAVVPDSPALNPTNALTLETWVYLPAYPTNDSSVIVGKDVQHATCQYLISVGRVQGQYVFRSHVGVPSGLHYFNGITPVQTNTWYHVAMTYDGAFLRLYVNGKLDGAQAVSGPIVTGSNPLQVGGYGCGPWNLVGRVDELALYNRALFDAEIRAIYTAGSAGKCPSGPLVAPTILSQPANLTVYAGQSARFSVQASGTPPLGYQWRWNGYYLLGQTNASLLLSNVQLAQAGTYSVLVTNPAGLVLSSNAQLTVLPVQTNCTPPPTGMVAWWRAEGTVFDSASSTFGALSNGATFAPGKVGQAFSFNGSNSFVQVADRLALRLTNALTIEFWVKRQRLEELEYLLEKGGDWTGGTQNYAVAINTAQNGSCLHFLFANGWRGAGRIADTNWHHCAVVAIQGQTDPTFYIDGVRQTITYREGASTINLYPSTRPLHIGAQLDPQTGWFYYGKTLLDELTLYNRPLSAAEVQAIYLAGSAGKCASSTQVPPSITIQPTSKSVYVGQNATFYVGATGTAPLRYQWRFNGMPLPGQTNTGMVITNVQPANAGAYSVLVTNLAGAVFSSNALLTVLPSQPNCTPAPTGLVAWWRAENNALDSVSGTPGALSNGVTFAAGKVGQAFSFDGVDAYVKVPASSGLDVGLGDGLTVETWIQPTDVGNGHSVVEWSRNPGGAPYGTHLWVGHPDRPPGYVFANLADTQGGYHVIDAEGVVVAGQLQHLALTYSKTSGLARLLVNGAVVREVNLGTFTPQTSYDLYFGCRPPGDGYNTFYAGMIDEISLYNRALSTNEIQAIYLAGSAGKCASSSQMPPSITTQPTSKSVSVGQNARFSVQASGTAPLCYQWRFNGYYLLGQTNASLVLSNVQLAQAGTYSVLVTNPVGLVLSSNALLTVLNPQTNCTPAPIGMLAWWRAEGSALDSVDSHHGMLFNGVSFAPGQVGQGFSFNGARSFIQVSNSPAFNLTNALTIEFWYKDTGSTGTLYGLVAKRAPYPLGCNFGINFYPHQTNGLQVYLQDPNYPSYQVSTCPVPQPGVFHHLAATYRQVTAEQVELRTYIDGQLVKIGTVPGNLARTLNNASVTIGADNPNEDYFVGIIDELSLYQRALSSTEISAIYLAGNAGKCPSSTPVPPSITIQPTSKSVSVGQSAVFYVGATGTAPLGYQWRFNGAILPGQTNTGLVVSNVQLTNAGFYSVLVTNLAGAVFSSNALLTVLSAQPNCTPAPAGLVAWWRAESNALDSVDSNYGLLLNGTAFAPGKVGQAFALDGIDQLVQIPNRPALNPTNALTLEAWVYVSAFSDNDSVAIIGKDDPYGARQYLLGMGNSTGKWAFRAHLGVLSGYEFFNGTTALQTNTWYHTAITYDGAYLRLFVNGILDGSLAVSGPIVATTNPLLIGGHASGPWNFDGRVDEVSLYSRALSPAELQAIYLAGSAGKCASSTQVPPSITIQPTSKSVYVGQNATFYVGATGTAPLRYQWRFNGMPLPGQTNTGMVITNVQPANAGAYSVLVTNLAGAVFSSNALLTVLPSQPNCTPAPTGLVAWWRAEGNVSDNVDGHLGLLLKGPTFTNGEVGLGFNFDGINDGILVSNSPSLNFGSNADFSIEAWIKPQPASTSFGVMTIADKRFVLDSTTAVGYELYLQDGRLACALADLPNYDQSDFQSSGPDLRDGKFHHVAWTLHRAATNGGKLYVDGQVVLTFDPTVRSGDLSNPEFLRLGFHPDFTLNTFFKGVMDEVSIYRRALSITEVQAIYLTGIGGKCPSGPPAGQAPLITRHPQGTNVVTGASCSLWVSVTGTQPLSYQWSKNSLPLPGATNSFLTITNARPTDAGAYSVVVSNAYGAALSSNAFVTVQAGAKTVLLSGSSMNSTVQSYLTTLGYTSTLVPYSTFSSVPLTNCNAIWLGAGVSLSTQRSTELVNFVTNGGIVVVEVVNPLMLPACPFGRQLAFSNAASDTVRIVDHVTPVNAGLTDAGLSGWSASVHGYFTDIGSFTGLTDTGSSGRWVTILMSLGRGYLIYTTQDISYHIQYGYGATGPTSPKGLFLNNLFRLPIPPSRPPLPPPGTLLPLTPHSRGLKVSFVGHAGQTYALQRATSIHGPWVTLTNVTVSETGVGSFLDTTAPPSGAYYRALHP